MYFCTANLVLEVNYNSKVLAFLCKFCLDESMNLSQNSNSIIGELMDRVQELSDVISTRGNDEVNREVMCFYRLV